MHVRQSERIAFQLANSMRAATSVTGAPTSRDQVLVLIAAPEPRSGPGTTGKLPFRLRWQSVAGSFQRCHRLIGKDVERSQVLVLAQSGAKFN